MEVLSATRGVKPLPLQKVATAAVSARLEPRKLSLSKFSKLSSAISASLLSLSIQQANALTYDEALSQTLGTGSPFSSGFDISEFIDGLLKNAMENPLLAGGAVAVVAVPLFVSQVFGKPSTYGVVSAKNAYAALQEDGAAQLLDIREVKELRETGKPDLRAAKKKAVSVTFKRDDKLAFLKKLELKFKEPETTTLFVLDKFDGNSEFVAELVTSNGFKSAFAIRDGAEGSRGWTNSGLPWSSPKKGLDFDLDGLKDALSNAFGETSSDGLPLTLGLVVATGIGLLAFTEVETLLQLLGSAAAIQLVTKKFLFAEDRKATVKQIDEFLNTKVAPRELLDEMKMIGQALLPVSTSVKSLPPPENAAATVEPAAPVFEMSSGGVSDTIPYNQRPLSPYPSYPDLKPPSSPSPSSP